MKHKFKFGDDVRIVKDLSGVEPGVVGCSARVLALLPGVRSVSEVQYPKYKVLIFGEGKTKGGIFEADERELSRATQ